MAGKRDMGYGTPDDRDWRIRRLLTVMAGSLSRAGSRRQRVGTVLAGIILGVGSVAIGSTLVQASERDGIAAFFTMLFGGGGREAEVRTPPKPTRYNTLPGSRLDRAPHRLLHPPHPAFAPLASSERLRRHRPQVAIAADTLGHRGDMTVCVRRCDGYLFPLGRLRGTADLPVHRAGCAAACPNAATDVYTLAPGVAELDRAVSERGTPYRASAVANVYRQRRVADCSCQPPGGARHAALETDQTLRSGDVVATGRSAEVVTRIGVGRVDMRDYRRAAIPQRQVRAIENRVGTIRREAAARSFRRQLRSVETGRIVQVAHTDEMVPPVDRTPTVEALRIVTPSPYAR